MNESITSIVLACLVLAQFFVSLDTSEDIYMACAVFVGVYAIITVAGTAHQYKTGNSHLCSYSSLIFPFCYQIFHWVTLHCRSSRQGLDSFIVGYLGVARYMFYDGQTVVGTVALVFQAFVSFGTMLLEELGIECGGGPSECKCGDEASTGQVVMNRVFLLVVNLVLFGTNIRLQATFQRVTYIQKQIDAAATNIRQNKPLSPSHITSNFPECLALTKLISSCDVLRPFISDAAFTYKPENVVALSSSPLSDDPPGNISPLDPLYQKEVLRFTALKFNVQSSCLTVMGVAVKSRQSVRVTSMKQFVTAVCLVSEAFKGTVVDVFNGSALILWRGSERTAAQNGEVACKAALALKEECNGAVVTVTQEQNSAGHVRSDSHRCAMFVLGGRIQEYIRRLTSLGEGLGANVVLSPSLVDSLGPQFVCIPLDRVQQPDGTEEVLHDLLPYTASSEDLALDIAEYREAFKVMDNHTTCGNANGAFIRISQRSSYRPLLQHCWRLLEMTSRGPVSLRKFGLANYEVLEPASYDPEYDYSTMVQQIDIARLRSKSL